MSDQGDQRSDEDTSKASNRKFPKIDKPTTGRLWSSPDSTSFGRTPGDLPVDLNGNLENCPPMTLVVIFSNANQGWLSAVFHLAVLILLQLLAVWANRRWAASRAARAQNDPAKLVEHGHFTPCPKGRKLMSLVVRILLWRACIWMWLVGLYTIIVWDLHYVPPFDADLPPAAWHWRFPFVVTLLLALNVVMSIIHITNNQLRGFAAAKSAHGFGVAMIALAEVLQIFLPLSVAYFALPVLANTSGRNRHSLEKAYLNVADRVHRVCDCQNGETLSNEISTAT